METSIWSAVLALVLIVVAAVVLRRLWRARATRRMRARGAHACACLGLWVNVSSFELEAILERCAQGSSDFGLIGVFDSLIVGDRLYLTSARTRVPGEMLAAQLALLKATLDQGRISYRPVPSVWQRRYGVAFEYADEPSGVSTPAGFRRRLGRRCKVLEAVSHKAWPNGRVQRSLAVLLLTDGVNELEAIRKVAGERRRTTIDVVEDGWCYPLDTPFADHA